MLKLKLFCLSALFTIAVNSIVANNITVSNVTLSGQNSVADYTMVQFDIGWSNSWRVNTGPSNWDAAWIFVKFRIKTQTNWNHATLNWVNGTGAADGHAVPANGVISSSNDNGAGGAYGIFLYSNTNILQANASYPNVQLRWNYGMDGLSDNDSVEVCVFAIEMVHIPQGNYFLGDGTTNNIQGQFENGNSGNALQITSEGALILGGSSPGSIGNNNASGMIAPDDFNDAVSQILPAAFPKGHRGFYCMKYEVTQGQYIAFLNKLTTLQAISRAYTGGASRNGISGSPGNYTTTNPYVACNFLSWADLSAYLDWAALRPMTELEFEKAARGSMNPIANEYVWGSTDLTGATGISNPGLPNETASNAGANCAFGSSPGVQGPMRAGNFGQGINTRVGVGAGYFGVLELSGNLMERCISVGNASGRMFNALQGNGVIDANGNSDVSNWPGINALGVGMRGGNWYSAAIFLRISDRNNASNTNTNRPMHFGGRGVRTAP